MDEQAQKKVIDIVQEYFGQNISNETKELIARLVIQKH